MFQTLPSIPDFEFLFEDFDYNGEQRSRTTAVRGKLSPSLGGPRHRTSTVPLSLYSPSGAHDARPPHYESGHLVGLEIGGPDCSANTVPMTGGVNRGTYRAMERAIYALASLDATPTILIMLEYPAAGSGGDIRIPDKFHIYYKTAVTELKKLIPMGPSSYNISNSRSMRSWIDVKPEEVAAQRAGLMHLRGILTGDGWKLEDVLPAAHDWAARGFLPDPAHRPYAVLDRLAYDPAWVAMAWRYLPYPDFGVTASPGRAFAT